MMRSARYGGIMLVLSIIAFIVPSISAQRWKLEFGDPKAKVKLEVFYPLGFGGHEWVVEYVKEIVKAHPHKVYAVVIDWSTEQGARELGKRGLSCGAFFINGKRTVKVNGKQVEFIRTPLLGGWTKEQLKRAVAEEVRRAYGGEEVARKVEGEKKQGVKVLTVFVPCAVAGPYVDIEHMFEERYKDIKLKEKIENVLVLAKRLSAGETPDLYISVGEREVSEIAKKRGIKGGDIVKVARSRLSLIVPKGNPKGIKSLSDIASKHVSTIALARENTSIGYCSRQVLERLGIWEKVKGKVVYAKFPAELKGWVQQRRVDAAIVYHPCLYEAHEVGQRPKFAEGVSLVCTVPSELHDEIPVVAFVMPNSRNAPCAKKFVSFMLTDVAQKAFEEWKFEPIKMRK
jgi:molybdate transport system substrate-binding protein